MRQPEMHPIFFLGRKFKIIGREKCGHSSKCLQLIFNPGVFFSNYILQTLKHFLRLTFNPLIIKIMRITKSILFTALFAMILGTATANSDSDPNTNTARNEIKTLIQKSNLASELNSDMTVNVTFMVNAKNEIIIMSTDQEKLDRSIKSTLNYKKLKSSDMKVNVTYTLPVILKK